MTATETDRAAFLRKIAENPDDQLAKSIYADWLDERGETFEAAWMRSGGEVLTLPLYRGRRGYGKFRRCVSPEEMARHCEAHSHVWFQTVFYDAKQFKVNGKVRRWKRDPDRVEVPAKYGLYEYGTFHSSGFNRVLIPLEPL